MSSDESTDWRFLRHFNMNLNGNLLRIHQRKNCLISFFFVSHFRFKWWKGKKMYFDRITWYYLKAIMKHTFRNFNSSKRLKHERAQQKNNNKNKQINYCTKYKSHFNMARDVSRKKDQKENYHFEEDTFYFYNFPPLLLLLLLLPFWRLVIIERSSAQYYLILAKIHKRNVWWCPMVYSHQNGFVSSSINKTFLFDEFFFRSLSLFFFLIKKRVSLLCIPMCKNISMLI